MPDSPLLANVSDSAFMKMYENFMGKASKVANNIIAPTDAYGMPNVGGLDAMVPTVANLPMFKSLMADARTALAKQMPNLSQEALDALAYTKVRYPKHYSTPTTIKASDTLAPSTGGSFFPSTNNVVFKDTGRYNAPELISIINHELTHAVDSARKGAAFLMEGRPEFQEAIGMKGGLRRKLTPEEIDQYKTAIPSEKRAYQAGDTATKGYSKLKQLMFDAMAKVSPGSSFMLE